MIIDLKRDARQEESVDKWKRNYGVGCIHACPRFGKTRVGLKVSEKYYLKRSTANILVVVPSEIICKHWEALIDNNYMKVMTVNKARNTHITEPYDILIIDELHKFTSEENLKTLEQYVKVSKYRLGLTANYPSDNDKIRRLFPVVDVITEQEARANNWISEYVEYNIPVELTDEEKVRYIKYSGLISETLTLFRGKAKMLDPRCTIFENDYELINSCYVGKKPRNIPGVKYISASTIREGVAKMMGWKVGLDLSTSVNKDKEHYWNPNNIMERAKAFKQFVANRNEILINNETKLNMVLDIIKQNDVPTIIFNESIEFVNIIADKLGKDAIAYHSKISSRPMIDEEGNLITSKNGNVKMFGAKRLKDMAINGIKSGRYKYLVTAKALDEGLDLPELEQVIITAGSTNPIQQQQRSGRGKTLDQNNTLKLARIFNVYIEDFRDMFGELIISRDKSKLITRQKEYTHSVVWLNNLADLTL